MPLVVISAHDVVLGSDWNVFHTLKVEELQCTLSSQREAHAAGLRDAQQQHARLTFLLQKKVCMKQIVNLCLCHSVDAST